VTPEQLEEENQRLREALEQVYESLGRVGGQWILPGATVEMLEDALDEE